MPRAATIPDDRETCHHCRGGFPVGFRRIHMNDGFIYHEGCLATGKQEGLDKDHWLVSGRIDGLRVALDVMADSETMEEAATRIHERIAKLMR